MEEAAAGVVVIFVLVLILLLVGEPTYHSILDRPHSFLRKRAKLYPNKYLIYCLQVFFSDTAVFASSQKTAWILR